MPASSSNGFTRQLSHDATLGWNFACGPVPWAGYDIIPLTNDVELWDEGQAMPSRLYKIRRFCNKSSEPSRFFYVRKNGLRCATLELVQGRPCESGHGLGLMDGLWQLQDCRLSHNRLPPDELVKLLDDFGRHYDTLAQQAADEALAAAPMQQDRRHWPARNALRYP